jgi:hypothetical protein
MELLFDEASKFPSRVTQNHAPVSVITKGYLSLPTFIGLDNYKNYLLPENMAQRKFNDMLNAQAELEKLSSDLSAMIKGVHEGLIILRISKSDSSYSADVAGLQKALNDVTTAEEIIKNNTNILRNWPLATEASTPGFKTYVLPSKTRFDLPLTTELSTRMNRPVVGSAVSACAFTTERGPRAYAFWQDSSRAIYTSALTDMIWALGTESVVASVRAHTPLTACCSSDGKEVCETQKTTV